MPAESRRLCLQANEADRPGYSGPAVFPPHSCPVIEEYNEREAELKLTLQILIVPILLMLIFYIFMVSQLMIRSETSIISVLESRGAGRSQILLLYGLESLLPGRGHPGGRAAPRLLDGPDHRRVQRLPGVCQPQGPEDRPGQAGDPVRPGRGPAVHADDAAAGFPAVPDVHRAAEAEEVPAGPGAFLAAHLPRYHPAGRQPVCPVPAERPG